MAQGPKGELEFAIPELVEVKQVSYLWHACTGFLTACSGLLSCSACFCWHWAHLCQQQTKKLVALRSWRMGACGVTKERTPGRRTSCTASPGAS